MYDKCPTTTATTANHNPMLVPNARLVLTTSAIMLTNAETQEIMTICHGIQYDPQPEERASCLSSA